MASAANLDLMKRIGNSMAEDMMHAQIGANASAFAGIYAPGANIHRSPYLGRHNEYFSEDGWLAGEICAAEVQGIREKGVLAFVKHFALNDQEEGRYGISVWANEQAIREVYLESFEGAIRSGAMNVMSSFNRIGVVWAGAHHGLMTGILRDEWGMEGSSVTDMALNAGWMDVRLGLLAGQDYWLSQRGSNGSIDSMKDDPAIASALFAAVKNVIYGITRTHAMNIGNATVVAVTPWWQIALYGITAGMVLLTLLSMIMMVRKGKKLKKQNLQASGDK